MDRTLDVSMSAEQIDQMPGIPTILARAVRDGDPILEELKEHCTQVPCSCCGELAWLSRKAYANFTVYRVICARETCGEKLENNPDLMAVPECMIKYAK